MNNNGALDRLKLTVERLSSDELAKLAAWEQAEALNECMTEIAWCGRESIEARSRLAAEKIALLKCEKNSVAYIERKSRVIAEQAHFDNLRDRARTMRELKNGLQNLLNNLPS